VGCDCNLNIITLLIALPFMKIFVVRYAHLVCGILTIKLQVQIGELIYYGVLKLEIAFW
jgi:hypothetical protein